MKIMNRGQNRQDHIREAAKYTKNVQNVVSFEAGAKWADYHPYWREDLPKPEINENDGLPKLYLCQILTLDMTFGYRHSYRIGFITSNGKWNIEEYTKMTRVVRWLEIHGLDSEQQLLEDIKKYEDGFVNEATGAIQKHNTESKKND